MNKIFDKLTITVFCCILMFINGTNPSSIIALLISVSISALCQLCGKSRISFIFQITYAAGCITLPNFILFIPILLYDIFSDKRYLICLTIFPAFFIWFSSFSTDLCLLIIGIIISFLLQKRTCAIENLTQQLIHTQDSSTELRLLLSEKNKHLLENQDYEIHLAILKERNRIAREIHDSVGHLLSRSILQIGAIRITCNDKQLTECLESLSSTLNNAMTTIRQSVHDLHDDSVDLQKAILDSIKPLYQKNINVNTELDFSDNVPNQIKFSFIGIIKEAVSNIVRHSSADTASFILREHPAFYQLIIEDNGCCKSEMLNENGIGLKNMRSRIKDMNGIININSDCNGFRIFITVKK